MTLDRMLRRPTTALAAAVLLAPAAMGAQADSATRLADPRARLRAGFRDAGVAARHMQLVAHRDKPANFSNPQSIGDFAFANSDLAFGGNFVWQGGYNGWQVWDISTPANPTLRGSLVCPGGQGDLSVLGNLLFMSVEDTRGRLDCGGQGVQDTVSAERFRGVRIFDITNVGAPRQVASVQTCRGSHTHTLVTDPKDPANVYVYVSGTSIARPAGELAGCSGREPKDDPNTSLFRIEVIQVPVSNPAAAKVVSMPRIFADTTGNIAGLWAGGAQREGAQETAQTNQCHDITAYPELGIAGGACSGNGILLDIRDPANPRRVAETFDPNFAYWHSATFNNDGSKVLFTDEWGGGTQARCRASDRPEWGADAIFERSADNRLTFRSYFKLPAAQGPTENCVAHNGSLVPVPGRDLFVQAWYQGGISVVDFTDAARPVEIAYFDRGPQDSTELQISGYWSAYWYNGHIYGSEIGRGLDVLTLSPSPMLSQNEIDAAKSVRMREFNPQLQTRITWPASFVVARAYVDQLERGSGLAPARVTAVRSALAGAEGMQGARRRSTLTQLATALDADARNSNDATKVRTLAAVVRELSR